MYANVWRSACVAKIDAATGEVVGWLDASRLRALIDEGAAPRPPYSSFGYDVNGIASDGDELVMTGKYWNKLMRVRETGAEPISDVEGVKRMCLVS